MESDAGKDVGKEEAFYNMCGSINLYGLLKLI